jgi:hypothetical protein
MKRKSAKAKRGCSATAAKRAAPESTRAASDSDLSRQLQTIRQLAAGLAGEKAAIDVKTAALQMALWQICRLLADLDEQSLKEQLAGDLAHYTRLLNALARLCAQAEPSTPEPAPEKPETAKGIAPETLEKIEVELSLL